MALRDRKMKGILSVALLVACCLTAAPRLIAQAPATAGDATAPGQKKQPAAPQQATPFQSNANPFPTDTSNVPVLPSKSTPAQPEGTYNAPESAGIPLPGEDLDPIRSPDDPLPSANSGAEADSSSSLAGLEKLLPPPDDDQPSKKKKLVVKEPTHQEAASKDIEVGTYYLQTKNWKGALSRFESALILDPENPDVYWGLAEAEHRVGNLADARAHYQKVVEYDPDSRHGKDAVKILKDPEIANGKNPPPSPPPATATQE
jgi:hypothetical protein